MKSPFPGMDPYLEQYWGDVHQGVAPGAEPGSDSRNADPAS
jgi:hypothetical protein